MLVFCKKKKFMRIFFFFLVKSFYINGNEILEEFIRSRYTVTSSTVIEIKVSLVSYCERCSVIK